MSSDAENTARPETFRDIQDDATRAVLMILPVLLVVYALSLGVVAMGFLIAFMDFYAVRLYGFKTFLFGALTGTILAPLHAFSAYRKPIGHLIRRLGAEQPDDDDHYYRTFSNVVEEITIAADIDQIQVGVIPTAKTNALAVGNRDRAAVIVTEGTLGQLRRDELQAVVAHEIAHVAYGDSRVKFFTANILHSFEVLNPNYYFSMKDNEKLKHLYQLGFYLVMVTSVSAMQGLNRVLSMLISQHREWRADAKAVEYARDPVALATALHKMGKIPAKESSLGEHRIVEQYHETLDSPSYESLLIVPFEGSPDKFLKIARSHPPLRERIDRILSLAGVSDEELDERLESDNSTPHFPVRATRDEDGNRLLDQNWLTRTGDEEQPVDLVELLSGGVLEDGGMIRRDREEEWYDPDEHPHFSTLKKIYRTEGGHGLCPDCGARLRRRFYLGVPLEACVLCGGVALSWRKTIRLESRYDNDELPEHIEGIEEYSGYHGGEPIPEDEPVNGLCPECETPFSAKRYRDTKLIVDRCPSCLMGWFEEDELTIALSLSGQSSASEPNA